MVIKIRMTKVNPITRGHHLMKMIKVGLTRRHHQMGMSKAGLMATLNLNSQVAPLNQTSRAVAEHSPQVLRADVF